jgi:hypothetical protein
MDLVREMEPRSGLDLADPANPATAGRTTPTLLTLPRGNFYGGRSGHGYDFPAQVLSMGGKTRTLARLLTWCLVAAALGV